MYNRSIKESGFIVEMQAVTSLYLPKRTRYYQSMTDLQLVDKGQDYDTLNNSYIIFICLSDLFGKTVICTLLRMPVKKIRRLY